MLRDAREQDRAISDHDRIRTYALRTGTVLHTMQYASFNSAIHR